MVTPHVRNALVGAACGTAVTASRATCLSHSCPGGGCSADLPPRRWRRGVAAWWRWRPAGGPHGGRLLDSAARRCWTLPPPTWFSYRGGHAVLPGTRLLLGARAEISGSGSVVATARLPNCSESPKHARTAFSGKTRQRLGDRRACMGGQAAEGLRHDGGIGGSGPALVGTGPLAAGTGSRSDGDRAWASAATSGSTTGRGSSACWLGIGACPGVGLAGLSTEQSPLAGDGGRASARVDW